MNARDVALTLSLTVLLGSAAVPAAEGDERRGSVPPGTSQDGSGPSAGAIKGGSIDRKDTVDTDSKREPDVARCRDLTGTLRSQCIADARKDAGRAESK
jgi:hypothetical protein